MGVHAKCHPGPVGHKVHFWLGPAPLGGGGEGAPEFAPRRGGEDSVEEEKKVLLLEVEEKKALLLEKEKG